MHISESQQVQTDFSLVVELILLITTVPLRKLVYGRWAQQEECKLYRDTELLLKLWLLFTNSLIYSTLTGALNSISPGSEFLHLFSPSLDATACTLISKLLSTTGNSFCRSNS